MAQLPTAADLGARSVTRSGSGRASDPSGVIEARGIQQFGETIRRIGADMAAREDRYRYAQAKRKLLTADIKTRRELEDVEDYETWEKRYREAMTSAQEEAAGTIKSNHDRALFETDAGLSIERGSFEVAGAVKAKETDIARADLSEGLEELRTVGLEATDPGTRADIIRSANDLMASAKEQGYISAQEAEHFRSKWTADYAEGSIAMMISEDAIAVLSDDDHPLNEYLDPVERKQLLEAKRDEFNVDRVRIQTQATVDEIMEKHRDRGAALIAARKIKDPEVRDQAVSDVNQRFNELSVIESERHREAVDSATDLVEQGKSVKSIDPRVLTQLSIGERRTIESRAAQLAAGLTPDTDWDLFYETVRQATDDPVAFQQMKLATLKSRLAPQEYQRLWELQKKIGDPVINAGLQTSQQVVDAALENMGISTAYLKSGTKRQKMSQTETRFRRMVDERLRAHASATGKIATAAQTQEIVDGLVLQTVFIDEFGGDPEIPAFTVSQDQAGDAYVPIDRVPALNKTEIANMISFDSGTVTDAKIERAYAAYLMGDKARFLEIISE